MIRQYTEAKTTEVPAGLGGMFYKEFSRSARGRGRARLGDDRTRTFVTLVDLNKVEPRSIVVQGGAYAEHRIESAEVNGKLVSANSPSFTLKLAPGAGAGLTLKMKRYSEKATVSFPEAVR